VIGRGAASVIGVALSHDHVRAVALDRGRITWSREEAFADDDELPSALSDVIAEARQVRAKSRVLAVAVGPAHAQLRRLHGLPPVRDPRVLAAIVQQNTNRYFRQPGVPLVTTSLGEQEEGRAWAGAIEARIIDWAADLCREHGFESLSIAPTAAVLGHAAPGCAFTWHDGDLGLAVRYAEERLAECRCLPSFLLEGEHGSGATLADALSPLGDNALRFADAYAAAHGGATSPLAVRPDRGARQRAARRLASAAATFAFGVGFIALAPTIAAMRIERTATARLTALSPATAQAQRVARAIADSARLLSQLVAFQRSASSKTLLLASMSCAIEEPAMLLSLRLEPTGGTLTALAPTAAALLTMLGEVPAIESPVIVGSVTPELPPSAPAMALAPGGPAVPADAARSLERVTVRFQWRSGNRLLPAPRCDG
jgi:hypothetical protein